MVESAQNKDMDIYIDDEPVSDEFNIKGIDLDEYNRRCVVMLGMLCIIMALLIVAIIQHGLSDVKIGRLNMTNKEKYGDKIIELAINTGLFCIKNGEPVLCAETKCKECDFLESDSCKGGTHIFREWLNSEYVEPPVDWSKVAVDTPILVRATEDSEWTPRYFAKYENGRVYAWGNGSTSWSAEGNMCVWEFAKLVKSEE